MPANLPPQYLEAEERFRQARTQEEKIEFLEEMLALLPKHKGTDKIRAQLRRRMAKLQDDAGRRTGTRKGYDPYLIRREGAGQVALYGLPNGGKSSLVSALTKAHCEVAEYPFTTRMPTPGMMAFMDIQIQLIDLPPLMDEASRPWLPRVLRKADSLAFVLDAGEDSVTQMEILLEGLEEMGLGLDYEGNDDTGGTKKLVRGLICLNKVDLLTGGAEEALRSLTHWPLPRVAVSTRQGQNLEFLRRAVFESLRIIRVYTKAPRKKADLSDPVIIPRGSTMEEAARALHKDFAQGLKYARVWGEEVFDGQMVGRDHVLHDRDIVEFHM